MYNTLAISTHVCQIFLKYAIPTHFNIFENVVIIVQ
jgi:hypothetical protein